MGFAEVKRIFDNYRFLLSIVNKGSKKFLYYVIFDAIKSQLLIFLEHTILVRYIIQCVESGEPFYKVLIAVAIVFSLYAISFIPDGLYYHKLELEEKPKIQKCFNDILYEKAKNVDLEFYDNSDYYNSLIMSVSESENIINRFISTLSQFIKCIMVFLTTGLFYLTVDGVGLFFLLLSFTLNIFVGNKLNKLNYAVRMEVVPLEKKQKYVGRFFYLNKYAKEVRKHREMSDSFVNEYHECNRVIVEKQKKIGTKRMWLDFVQKYLLNSFTTNVVYIMYLLYKIIVLHSIAYSDAIVLFNRVGEIRRATRDMSNVFPMINENSMYINRIRDFLKLTNRIDTSSNEPIDDVATTIEFRNVAFQYPNTEQPIINNLNFKVNPGEKIAIVGHNGAGKSTLIKLLLRLYDPVSGEVLLGGKNIRELDIDQYRNCFGVVFQDFQIYAASVFDNVVLDDIDQDEYSTGLVVDAIAASGLEKTIKSLDNYIDTELTQEFDVHGINLSGGESQKIAIARTFASDVGVLIMDEPSSALDPIAEYSLNKVMHRMSLNKTVFYISHRLSTTRDADRILVMDNGGVAEEGTHDELLKLGGIYAHMWNVQASRYQ